jgi:Fe-S cluster biogenesis protein NfuA
MSAKVTIEINLEFTPNPNTLKYSMNRQLLVTGPENYTSKAEADIYSPLAAKLFALNGINGVMIGSTFITVTINDMSQLRELNKQIMSTLKDHLESGETICIPRDKSEIRGKESETSQRIRRIIDEEIRPMVAMDGGDITFERLENGIVYLEMVGACSGCPSSSMTLKMGIQNRLQQEFPEVIDVVPISGY